MHPADERGLFAALEQLTDPRGRQGQRHPFAAMLAATICATLCGITQLKTLEKWLRSQEPRLWHWLGFKRRPPCANCFAKLFQDIDPDEFEAVVREWTASLEGLKITDEDLQAVSIDGKTLCGTMQRHERAMHLLSAFDHKTGYVLSQLQMPPETNEHKAALSLLKTLVLRGKVIIGDAMFCQRDVCEQVLDSGGDYFVVVKGNQEQLHRDITLAFTEGRAFPPLEQHQLEAERETHRSVSKGHGRVEVRELTSTTLLTEYLDWPGVKQVCRLVRTTTGRKPNTSGDETDVAYAITSVSRDRADAKQLLKWWRDHWGIENKVHYVRDEAFREDRCRVRTGASAHVLASFRNLAINWLRSAKVPSITAALQENTWHTHRLLTKFGYPDK